MVVFELLQILNLISRKILVVSRQNLTFRPITNQYLRSQVYVKNHISHPL